MVRFVWTTDTVQYAAQKASVSGIFETVFVFLITLVFVFTPYLPFFPPGANYGILYHLPHLITCFATIRLGSSHSISYYNLTNGLRALVLFLDTYTLGLILYALINCLITMEAVCVSYAFNNGIGLVIAIIFFLISLFVWLDTLTVINTVRQAIEVEEFRRLERQTREQNGETKPTGNVTNITNVTNKTTTNTRTTTTTAGAGASGSTVPRPSATAPPTAGAGMVGPANTTSYRAHTYLFKDD